MVCLKANAGKVYLLGIGQPVAVSTITRANESRSFQIYEDLAMWLIKEAKHLYLHDDDLKVHLKGNVFAVDATTIDLCLSTFYWVTSRTTKAGIKKIIPKKCTG